MTRHHPPTRTLSAHPDIDQLKRQAKELLRGFTAGDAASEQEVNAHYHGADRQTFALHDAQLVLARAYGFESWPRLKAFVDGVTVRRLVDAVRARNLEQVHALLTLRPELARMSMDNFQVVHHAVLARAPEMVRLLMANGANARDGVYPHRAATTAHAIAVQRGYSEIVGIIEEEEQKRRDPVSGEDRFAPPKDPFREPAAAAIARGDADWLRARHAEGTLRNPIDDSGGLLRIAAAENQAEILKLLLDFGFDPDERIQFTEGDEPAFSWGMALQHCASTGKYQMAEMLLEHGADPNARIMASGDPMFSAYSEKDWTMVALLERYGGITNATTAGLFRQTELARKMLSGEAPYRLDGVGGDTLAEQLLWGGACGGDPESVRMALARVDWPRDDPRWFTVLEQPLRTWTHGSGSADWPPDTYLTCFKLVLERCDPDLRGRPTDGGQFGLTTLHNIVARGDMTPEERVGFATAILDRGARLDIRDNLLKSTPLGWACRWGQAPLVKLFLDRGANPVEPDAEPWATPRAWAANNGHSAVLALLSVDPLVPEG